MQPGWWFRSSGRALSDFVINPYIYATAGAFDPTDVSGLTAWYDASDTGSLTLSGSEVTQWNDLSGNGFHLTRIDTNTGPDSGTRTKNSLNVLDFSGGKRLGNNGLASTSSYSIFVVCVQDSTPGSPFIATIAYFQGGTEHGIRTTSTKAEMVSTAGGAVVVQATAYTNGNWRQLYGSHDGGNIALRQNASAIGTSAVPGAPASNPFRVGAYANGSRALDGGIAEVLIYRTVLTNGSDIDDIEAYLDTKWGGFP
jgi:hypothetical protein